MRICTIDPGASGYLCFLDILNSDIQFHKTTTDPHLLIHDIKEFAPDILVIEEVHSVFGSSAKANFSFGFNVGLLHGIINASNIGTIHMVQPKEWQKTLGITAKGKAIKKEVAEVCKQYYPEAELYGKRGGLQDGKSDSLGIAIHVLKQRKKYENLSK